MKFQFETGWGGGGGGGVHRQEKINKRRLAGIRRLKLKVIFNQIDII